jgi:prophage DNA circulation protein
MNGRNWPATVAQPSFRGVPFEVDTDGSQSGRRVVTHEYMAREFWDNEDLGIGKPTINVTGYVYGDDADKQVESLKRALLRPGPGTLVLPARPIVQARCLSFNSTWAANAMGIFTIQMQFIAEADQPGGFISSTMLAMAVSEGVKSAAGNTAEIFRGTFQTLKRSLGSAPVIVPALARNAAVQTIVKASRDLDAARKQISGAKGISAANLEYTAREIRRRATEFVSSGAQGSRIGDVTYASNEEAFVTSFPDVWNKAMTTMASCQGNPSDVATAFAGLTQFEGPPLPMNLDTLSVRAEGALTQDVQQYVQRSALLYWTQALTRLSFGSANDALELRATLTSTFRKIVDQITDTALAEQLTKVRNSGLNYLSSVSQQGPAEVTVELDRVLPAVLISYWLYGDASRDIELVRRNNAGHPLFMPTTILAASPRSR